MVRLAHPMPEQRIEGFEGIKESGICRTEMPFAHAAGCVSGVVQVKDNIVPKTELRISERVNNGVIEVAVQWRSRIGIDVSRDAVSVRVQSRKE